MSEERAAVLKERLETEAELLRVFERVESELLSLPRTAEHSDRFNDLMRMNARAANAAKMRVAMYQAEFEGTFGPN